LALYEPIFKSQYLEEKGHVVSYVCLALVKTVVHAKLAWKFGGPGKKKQCCEFRKCKKSEKSIQPDRINVSTH